MEAIQKTMTGSKNLPEKRIRAGSIVATIWSNSSLGKDGQTINYKTVSFERAYKDKNNEWKSTSSLRTNDIPKAILVLTKAFESLSMSDSLAEESL